MKILNLPDNSQTKLVTQKSYESERMFAERLANVFLFDNKVQVNYGTNNIAFCNVKSKQIWFDFPNIFSGDNDDLFKDMMTFKGLGFHEILHLKFTMNSRRAKRLGDLFLALLQRLEDGRIETLGVIEYEKLADYLIYAVNNVLLKDKRRILNNVQDELINAYILCYGRAIYFQDKDLLAKLRELILKIYGKEIAEKIEYSIDKYIIEPKSSKRVDIAEDLYNFLKNKNIFPNYQRGMVNTFIDITRDDWKRMPKEMKDLIKSLPKVSKIKSNIREEIKKKTKNVAETSKKRDKFEEKKKKDFEKLRKKRADLYDKMYDETEKDKREQKRKEINKLQDELEELSRKSYTPDGISKIHKQLDEMLDNKKDEQEDLVENNLDDLKGDLKAIGHSIDDVYSDSSFIVTSQMKSMATELEKGLKKMNNELVRGYVQKQKSGRINIRRYVNRSSLADNRVFNRWLPDKMRQTKILVNLFVDGSGSMHGDNWHKAINSCWIINEALNRDENKIMIYQFSTDFLLAKRYDEPFTVPQMINGGTYPASAIKDAIPKIEAYKKAKSFNYVVDIIITDGEFDVGNDSDEQITKLNKLGHETILIHIGHRANSNQDRYYQHKAKHYLGLKSFNVLVPELVKIFTEIKRALIRRAKVI